MDLDAWINDPPSESEDETVPTNHRYDDNKLFSDQNSTPEYPKARTYVEPTVEEIEKQRKSRKQTEQMNPFYLKDAKRTSKVMRNLIFFITNFDELGRSNKWK